MYLFIFGLLLKNIYNKGKNQISNNTYFMKEFSFFNKTKSTSYTPLVIILFIMPLGFYLYQKLLLVFV